MTTPDEENEPLLVGMPAGKGRVVTVAVDAMTFHKPVYVGDDVSCYCKLAKRGNTSITVLVEAWVRRRHSDTVNKVTQGMFTFVAVDANGKPKPLPPE